VRNKMVSLEEIAVGIPSKNRHEVLEKAIAQYPSEVLVIVVDSTEKPLRSSVINQDNVIYINRNHPLHVARNIAIDLALWSNKKYICHVDDDSFFKNPEEDLIRLAKPLELRDDIWVSGGVGAFISGFHKKTFGGIFYSSTAAAAFGMMTRTSCPIRFRVPRREDAVFSIDCWRSGGKVILNPDIVVKHLELVKGGTEEPNKGSYKSYWYIKYVGMLKDLFSSDDRIVITKRGVVYIKFKEFGIHNRKVELEVM